MTNTNFHRGNGYPTPTPSPPEHANSHLEDDSSVTVIASSRAVVGGRLTEATIVVSRVTGKITAIYDSIIPPYEFAYGTHYVDYSPHILMPGLVDAHVHLNEPGRTEWEGFWTGTRAAAFGGVTTVIDMPLNAIPPTTTVENLQIKIKAAQGQCWVDVGFYGGIVPGNASELKGLVKEGVRGFKGFLIDSGVDEFPAVSSGDIAKVMAELKDEKTVLMFHAEMIPPISDSVGDSVQMSDPPLAPAGPLYEYATFLSSRPSSFETYAIGEIISLAHLAPQLPLHIVHLSAIEAIPMLREARAQGVNITAETCFHYLALAAERVQHGDTRHKCCPPIRTQKNQDGLWDEILRTGNDSVIQTVVSDHSPCTPNLKLLPASLERVGVAKTTPASVLETSTDSKGNFFAAWGGISSVGLGLPILWTAGRRHNISIEDVVRWCCINTAAQVGLSHQKGDLKVGLDADFCVFDDTREWMLGRESMLFRNKVSPYEGKVMRGMVKETWVRGVRIFAREERGVAGFVNGKATGKLLLEPRTT